MKKLWQNRNKVKMKFFAKNGVQFLCIGIVAVVLFIVTLAQRFIFKEYESADMKEADSQVTTEIYYNYYLDGTPSMMGFMDQDGSNFYLLSEALQQLNRNTGLGNDFYICTNEILLAEASELYEFMRSRNNLVDYYRGDLDDGKVDILDQMELTRIFDANNGNVSFENGNGNVNVIITDLNFYKYALGEESEHNERMKDFAKEYANQVRLGNICIYDIYSKYVGSHTDENMEGDDAIYSENESSFFILVSAEDALAYEGFVNGLEQVLAEKGIHYANKYEVKNSIMNSTETLKVNLEKFYDMEQTELINFNYDRKFFELRNNLSDNAIGLRTITGQGKSVSFVKLPILETNEEKAFEAIAEVHYPKWFHYEKYVKDDIIRNVWVGRNAYQSKNYLSLGVEINSTVNPDILRDYYVIDVLLQMKEPLCYMPGWVEEVKVTNDVRKINLKNLVEEINSAKIKGYGEVNAKQKRVGNILIYVHFNKQRGNE